MRKTGLLLLNLGTPEAPTPAAVRDYLREFLMDPWVIDIPWPLRFALVHGIILRSRPAASAHAYAKIWTEKGSPLKIHARDLHREVSALLPAGCSVKWAMRYGSPSIESVVREFAREHQGAGQGLAKLVVLPLYPQYSTAATESSIRATRAALKKHLPGTPVEFVRDFYDHPGFVDSFVAVGRAALAERPADFVIFSFHGLPERQVRKLDRSGRHCLEGESCCDRITDANRDCYRAQSYATARAIASGMGLEPGRYEVAFQSRLDSKWIRPFTDDLYESLPKRGVRKVAVMCPSFVADCLETLEEVALRGREQFVAAGGEDLYLVPSLNSAPNWARAVAHIAGAI